jgi:hypothetical protein
MCRAYIEKVIRSYAVDAMVTAENPDQSVKAQRLMAKRFLAALKTVRGKTYPSVSLGQDHRFEVDCIIGSALIHEEQVVHLSAFPKACGEVYG